MDNATHLIGLDLGTSAIKGVRISPDGRVLVEAEVRTNLLFPREGWVEVDPEEHYGKVCGVLRELTSEEVAAVAMAAASGNALLTDGEGRPLTPILNWMDERAAQAPPAALAGLTVAEVRAITGWPCLTTFPLAQLAWMRENWGELYRRAGHYALDTDWLLYRLTGEWRMDHSTATTSHLQEQVTGTYWAPFLERLELPLEKLSPLVESGVVVGALTPAARRDTGLPASAMVVTGCFDHPAAARAMGVVEPGDLMLSCGTSWVGFTPALSREQLLAAEMLCDPFLSAQGGPWGGMFSVTALGRRIDWYVENLIAPGEPDPMRVFNEAAAAAKPGAGGLVIDLREPPGPVRASRENLSRAVMEGAARLLDEKIVALGAYGLRYQRAVMVGGPARSPVWPGIVKETTGIEVSSGGRAAGARGAAMLAGIGVGIYRDERAALAAWAAGRRA